MRRTMLVTMLGGVLFLVSLVVGGAAFRARRHTPKELEALRIDTESGFPKHD